MTLGKKKEDRKLKEEVTDRSLWRTLFGRAYGHVIQTVRSPVTGLEWPRGFQEVKVLRFHDNGTGRW